MNHYVSAQINLQNGAEGKKSYSNGMYILKHQVLKHKVKNVQNNAIGLNYMKQLFCWLKNSRISESLLSSA